jgi:Divergent InlB B-repeat domain
MAGVMSGICSASFDAGSTVTLIGGSTNNGSFDGFSGACTGGTCAIAIASGVTSAVSAAFSAAPQRLTVTAGPGSAGGGVVTSQPAGINCVLSSTTTSGTCTAFFSANSVVTLQQTTTGNAVFAAWSGDCVSDPCQLVMSEGRTALAIFQTQGISLSGGGTGNGVVTSVPSGISCTVTNGVTSGTCVTTFPPNTVVTLNATPSGLSSFSGYSGACNASTCTLTMTPGATNAITAQFTAPPTLTLSAALGSQGGGTLTSAPGGLSCTLSNASASGSCTFAYALNTVVTVTQTPTSGSVFLNWAGACTGSGTCQVPLTASRSVQALYRLAVPGSITINQGAGGGSGGISSSPGGLACSISGGTKSGICRAIFPVGSTVTLIPTVSNGSTFTGFSGACSGMTCVLTVPENGDLTVTANFN